MDLIWRSEKIIKFGAARKKLKLADLIWRFLPFCANCTKFSPRQIYPNEVANLDKLLKNIMAINSSIINLLCYKFDSCDYGD